MALCFIFHLHTGLRAGGGIGDEIEAPDGDAKEAYRILFDMTFFFFVIVILLAIIQGKWRYFSVLIIALFIFVPFYFYSFYYILLLYICYPVVKWFKWPFPPNLHLSTALARCEK
ncbi:unnamed protein product [Protopolystoma xenopodis]|uniref:Uncharacterized protein n=1 Tax=Protopolystoma xenopodis TaxID=117903 RepID=A0A3S5B7E1_9PLAT|nr:unnamed protein product [Protopolystoma xenopodis]